MNLYRETQEGAETLEQKETKTQGEEWTRLCGYGPQQAIPHGPRGSPHYSPRGTS